MQNTSEALSIDCGSPIEEWLLWFMRQVILIQHRSCESIQKEKQEPCFRVALVKKSKLIFQYSDSLHLLLPVK